MILECALLVGNIYEMFFPGFQPLPAPDPAVQMQPIPNEPRTTYEESITRT